MDENEVMSTSEEMSEVAEQTDDYEVETSEESEETQEVAEPVKEEQSKEENARFASIRRQAEADAQRKMDMQVARLCEGITHPVTGQPIRTFAEYEDAIHAQTRLQAEQVLQENNVDTSVLDSYINNNPIILQAQQILAENQQIQSERMIRKDIEEISQLDPSISTLQDMANLPTWNAILEKVQQGASLVDAYKLTNYNELMNRNIAGAKQAAINQARGKAHLESTESLGTSDNDIDVPQEIIAQFPDKSMKEIKKLYKQIYK